MLVLVYSEDGQTLLLKRAKPINIWQSVTGSLEMGESHADAARRELAEETGLSDEGQLTFAGVTRQFAIDPRWRHRFASGVVENVEFEWHYRIASPVDVRVDTAEHTEFRWLPIAAAADEVWSWTNGDALRSLAIR